MFHEALTAALDASGATRQRWARRVGVGESTLSDWLLGKDVPPPQVLYQLFQMVRDNPNCALEVRVLEHVFDQPASEVTSHDQRMHPTAGHYMLRPLRDQVLARLASLPTSEQERILLEMQVVMSACRMRLG